MRVKLRTTYASQERTAYPGDELDLPESEARELIEGRFAVPVHQMEAASFGNRRGERAMRRPRPHE